MIPLKMRRLFFGFTPRRLLGINRSILAHCPSLNQNKFARICWPPIRLTNPLNLNMVNWVLTLDFFDPDQGSPPPWAHTALGPGHGYDSAADSRQLVAG